MAAEIVSTYTNEAGEQINVYASGAEYNVSKGQIIRGPTAALITKENALEYVQRRIEIARQLATEGMDEHYRETGKLSTAHAHGEGWKHIVKKAAELVDKSSNSRGVAELGSFIGRATGTLATDQEGKSAPQFFVQNNTDPETARVLADVLRDVLKYREADDKEAALREIKARRAERLNAIEGTVTEVQDAG
jgi:hypothetical protein